MNDELLVEHDDHTEVYSFFMPENGSPYPITRSFIEETGVRTVNFDELSYAVWVYPKAESESFSVTIPRVKDRHTVRAVTIRSTPLDATLTTRCDHIKLKYLSIPSSVRYINIENIKRNVADLLNECTIEISPDNPYLCVCKNGIYSKDMTVLYYIFSPDVFINGCYEVPAGVKLIRGGAGRALRGLRRLTIPESVDAVEDRAFEDCPYLEYADIGAHNIALRAFCGCNSLKEIRLSDHLQKIGDHAFAYTEIQKLTIPPSVRDIGQYILQNADPTCLTLEIYSKNGVLPKMHGSPAEVGTLIVILSSETNEKLCEFVMLGRINKVFTEHGIDFTRYDESFSMNFNSQGFPVKVGFRAAQVRLSQLDESDYEKREFFKQYIANAAFLITLNAVMSYPNPAFDDNIKQTTYLDFVTDDDLLGLIDEAAQLNKPELTAWLMQFNHERKSRE